MQFAFEREEIIKRVRENRDRHVAEARESYEHFCDEALEEIAAYRTELDELERLARDRALPGASRPRKRVYFNATSPRSYERDYDRALAMLELSLTDPVELSEDDFSRFILDEWEWKDDFLETLASRRIQYDLREKA